MNAGGWGWMIFVVGSGDGNPMVFAGISKPEAGELG